MKQGASFAIKLGCAITCSMLLFSEVSSKPWRHRRQSSQSYTIDTLVVVDNVMYSNFQRWLNDSPSGQTMDQSLNSTIEQYVSLVAHQANARLATMTTSLNYQIRLQIVDIRLNLNILANVNTNAAGNVPSDNALNAFGTWLINSNLNTSQDHAVLLTGHTLSASAVQQGEANKGRSYTRGMCDINGQSSTIIQDNGGFQSVFFLVHELGHSLGADHDNVSLGCTPDRYIMSSVIGEAGKNTSNQDHPWYFSQCSINAIRSFVNTPAIATCLSSNLNPIPEFSATSNSTSGQLYKADTQCQMIYGSRSHVCYGGNVTSLKDICDTMYCLNPTGACDANTAAEGTSCGNKTWCKLGRCVQSADAPAMDPKDCPTGDSVEVFIIDNSRLNCSETIKTAPYLCYNTSYSIDKCCASCKQIRRNSTTCAYGDADPGYCNKDNCGKDPTTNRLCCDTCSADKCYDSSSIDELSCSDRVKMGNRQRCYDNTVKASCCMTCRSIYNNKPGCEYGDLYLNNSTCAAAKNDHSLCNTKTKLNCCLSCNSAVATPLWISLLSITLVITMRMI